jgi:N-acetylneuraminic acid mutarotase
LTANDGGSIAFLFGGRAAGKPLNDFWAFDRSTNAWSKLPGGPAARFGHSAAFIDGHLVVFGGQGGANTFFNDAWAFDPVHGKWTQLKPAGGPPAARYGAGGAKIGTSLTISHGFTDTGRFDDTWALSARWTDVSPKSGPRPIKRCLHRAVYLPDFGRMLLFGGQTDGRPFLGDGWLYNPTKQEWSQVGGNAPTARNLYALAGTAKTAYLFGGATVEGASNELWSFDASGWKKLKAAGTAPPARSGVEGAIVAGPSMLVFGGAGKTAELADLWELSIPA